MFQKHHNARTGYNLYQNIFRARQERDHKNNKCCREHLNVDVYKMGKNIDNFNLIPLNNIFKQEIYMRIKIKNCTYFLNL